MKSSTLRSTLEVVASALQTRNKGLWLEAKAVLADMANRPLDTTTIADELRINDKSDAEDAVIKYGKDMLLVMPQDIRTAVCQALIAMCSKFKVDPNPLWSKILGDPEFYNKWAEEEFGDDTLVPVATEAPLVKD